MFKIYRVFILLSCLGLVVVGICYSSMVLITLSEYVHPVEVALIALAIMFLSILIIPGLLCGALGTNLPNDESEE